MRSTRLDLGLALAAAARGYTVGRYSNPNEVLKLVDGAMTLIRKKGKNCLFSSLKTMNFRDRDYYIIGDYNNWLDTEVEV